MRRVELQNPLSLSIVKLDLCARLSALRSFGIRFALHEGLRPSLYCAEALAFLYFRGPLAILHSCQRRFSRAERSCASWNLTRVSSARRAACQTLFLDSVYGVAQCRLARRVQVHSLQLPPQRSKVYILPVRQCLRVLRAGVRGRLVTL